MNPFLYYTKGQRKAVYTLIILLALTFLFKIRYRILPSDNNEIPAVASAESERDSFNIKYQAFYTGFVENERRSKSRFSSAPKPPELFPFDPNKCDSATFVRLGLRRYFIGKMNDYLNNVGSFFTP